jgi:nitrogen fixation protein FixH
MSLSTPIAAPAVSTAPRLTGRKVLLIFALFFGTIFAVNVYLLVVAVRTFSGTETASAYRDGQLYNQEIARAQAQAARGWTSEAAAERAADGAARLSVALAEAGGRPLAGARVEAALQRPTDRRADHAGLDLALTATPGRYETRVADVAPGQWDLVVDVIEGGERVYRRKTRILLP